MDQFSKLDEEAVRRQTPLDADEVGPTGALEDLSAANLPEAVLKRVRSPHKSRLRLFRAALEFRDGPRVTICLRNTVDRHGQHYPSRHPAVSSFPLGVACRDAHEASVAVEQPRRTATTEVESASLSITNFRRSLWTNAAAERERSQARGYGHES
ncbi:hypothetical protein ACH492_16990 [Streptomyces sp. NPDC019443]|uniref:hypothetical protein n=1 Tax=Streptomyces sp. NPDC019443 TaxID=3365061 RepID=UPI0037949E24